MFSKSSQNLFPNVLRMFTKCCQIVLCLVSESPESNNKKLLLTSVELINHRRKFVTVLLCCSIHQLITQLLQLKFYFPMTSLLCMSKHSYLSIRCFHFTFCVTPPPAPVLRHLCLLHLRQLFWDVPDVSGV